MPSDINLLPDDLRRAEEDEQRRLTRRRPDERSYSAPSGREGKVEPTAQPLVPVPLAPATPPLRTSWFTRLLGRDRGKVAGSAPAEPIKLEVSSAAPVAPAPPKPTPPVNLSAAPKPASDPTPAAAVKPALTPVSLPPKADQALVGDPRPPRRVEFQKPDPAFESKPNLPPEPAAKPGWSLGAIIAQIRKRFMASSAQPIGATLEVNLVPREVELPSQANLWPVVGVVGAACALVAAAYLGLGYLNSRQRAEVEAAEAKLGSLVEEANGRIGAVEAIAQEVDGVRAVRALVASHVRWTGFFRWLEEHTLSDVYYAGFRGDISGKLTLVASTRDFITLSQQILAMQRAPEVASVSVSEASRGGDGWVNFNLSLELSPLVFISR